MKIDIFSIPIFINNIDSSKIILESIDFKENWKSEIKSSFGNKNVLKEDSANYLLSTINETIFDFIKKEYRIELINIWENHYLNNDFQENHIHAKSDFSFVIYKKIKESRTVFFAPNCHLIHSFYLNTFLEDYFKTDFFPKLKENQIIIFPSFLEHMVKKTSDSLTIAGNIAILKS